MKSASTLQKFFICALLFYLACLQPLSASPKNGQLLYGDYDHLGNVEFNRSVFSVKEDQYLWIRAGIQHSTWENHIYKQYCMLKRLVI